MNEYKLRLKGEEVKRQKEKRLRHCNSQRVGGKQSVILLADARNSGDYFPQQV